MTQFNPKHLQNAFNNFQHPLLKQAVVDDWDSVSCYAFFDLTEKDMRKFAPGLRKFLKDRGYRLIWWHYTHNGRVQAEIYIA